MGLTVSHDCFNSGYGYFHQWRKEIAKVAGLPPLELMEGFFYNDDDASHNPFWIYKFDPNKSLLVDDILSRLPIKWECLKKDCLHELLHHSDCDGYLRVGLLQPLADRLEKLLPNITEEWSSVTKQFIKGLRKAASKRERVTFG
jgi:hypothetical protein